MQLILDCISKANDAVQAEIGGAEPGSYYSCLASAVGQTTTEALPLHPARGIMPLDPVLLYNNYAPKVTASPVIFGAFIEKHGADKSKSAQGEHERAWRWFRKKAGRIEHLCIFTTQTRGPRRKNFRWGKHRGPRKVPQRSEDTLRGKRLRRANRRAAQGNAHRTNRDEEARGCNSLAGGGMEKLPI